jgi:two-component system cell cycle response regulator
MFNSGGRAMSIFSKDKLRKLAAEDAAEQQVKKKHSVLIVDDEEANLVTLASILEGRYNLLRASDGYEALAMIKEMDDPQSVCLVISDQRMPGLTGVMLLQELAVIMPKTIRIIVTGFIDVEAIIDSVNKAHIYQFILKPFDRIELLWTITRAVETYELQLAYKTLEELSLIDSLTKVSNRRFLLKHLDKDLAISFKHYLDFNKGLKLKPVVDVDLAFFMVDIDHFKQVNDTYGHEVGDQVLVQVKAVLLSVFSESDFLVRWGGEAFLVIARFICRSNVPRLAERLRQAFAEHAFNISAGEPLKKNCSVGFACYPFEPTRPEAISWMQLVDIADICMLAAKKSQRNAWVGIDCNGEKDIGAWFSRFNEHSGQAMQSEGLKLQTSLGPDTPVQWGKQH